MTQRVKLRFNYEETDSVVFVRRVRLGCRMSPVLFHLYGEYLINADLLVIENFKIGERAINKVRFADDTTIIAKTQEKLQDMANRLDDAGRK